MSYLTRGYCSKEHQHGDWKAHKVECKRITKARKAASAKSGGYRCRLLSAAPPPLLPAAFPVGAVASSSPPPASPASFPLLVPQCTPRHMHTQRYMHTHTRYT